MTDLVPRAAHVPGHVAIIMDGNGRWATQRSEHRTVGHAEGARAAIGAYQAARALGVRQLTLYAFSTANFKRPQPEVDAIMQILADFARAQCQDFIDRGIRLEIIGDHDRVPEHTRRSMAQTSAATADQDGMTLTIAIAYGSQVDLLQAVRALSARVRDGRID